MIRCSAIPRPSLHPASSYHLDYRPGYFGLESSFPVSIRIHQLTLKLPDGTRLLPLMSVVSMISELPVAQRLAFVITWHPLLCP